MKTTGKRAAWRKRICLSALTLAVAAVLLPSNILTMQVQAAVTVENPRIVEDPSMRAGQKVTWDYVWFGSYPQSEVVSTAMGKNYTSVNSSYFSKDNIIVSDSLYHDLTDGAHESEWDSKNEITLDGVKYRRIRKGDATYATGGASQYNWSNDTDYHYFKYEPIRWRVLSTDGETAFLLSDLVLDDQRFHSSSVVVNWGTSSIRSWLNGTFIGNAFTSAEQSSIVTTTVMNQANVKYGTSSGANTTDKVFLLSQSETGYTEAAAAYGFVENLTTYDEARGCKSSTYAKAMGVTNDTAAGYAGNCNWWLRSTGAIYVDAARVSSNGEVSGGGYGVVNVTFGVRPALNINVSSTEYSYGGTVCSDGTITVYKEEPPQEEEPPEEPPQEEPPEEPPQEEEPPEEPPQEEPPEEPPQEEIPEMPAEGGYFDGRTGGNGEGYQFGDGIGAGIGNGIGYAAIGEGTGIGNDNFENTNIFQQYYPIAKAGEVSQIETQGTKTHQTVAQQIAVQWAKKQEASARSAQISSVHTDAKVQAAMSAAGGGGSRVKLYEMKEEAEELPEEEEEPFMKSVGVLVIVLLATGILCEGTYFKRQRRKWGKENEEDQ